MPRVFTSSGGRNRPSNEAQSKRLREEALHDIWVFADIINFHGGSANFGNVHRELADFITLPQREESRNNRRRLVLMPRGHLKSTVCSVLYVLWRIYRNPNIRVLYATNIKRLARSFIRELRMYFENDDLKTNLWNKRPHIDGELVPALSAQEKRARNARRNQNLDYDEGTAASDTKYIWSMDAIQVTREDVLKEPTVQVTSVGTVVTGDHYDIVIMDDIIDFNNCDTQEKGDDITDWARDYESVLDPRQCFEYRYGVNKVFTDYLGDEVITLGTRYFEWDYYRYQLDNADKIGVTTFIRNIYVNGADSSDGFIWPEKFNESVIELIQKRINSSRKFASQYLNEIVTPEDCPLSLDNIRYFDVCHMQDNVVAVPISVHDVKYVARPITFIEPAATVGSNSDYSVILTGGYTEEKDLIILAIEMGRFPTNEVVNRLFAQLDTFKTNEVYVETVGGFALYNHIIREEGRKRKRPVVMRDYKPPTTLSKKTRVLARLEPLFESRKLWLPHSVAVRTDIRDQIALFPKGRHDDVPDAIASIATLANPNWTRSRTDKAAYNPPSLTHTNSRWGGYF